MNELNDNVIRERVLNALYGYWKQVPMGYLGVDELLQSIPVDETALARNILYLEEKGFVEALKSIGSLCDGATITAYGIDFVEGASPFNPDAIKVRVESLTLDPATKEQAMAAFKEIVESLENAEKKATWLSKLGDQGQAIAAELLVSIVRGFLFR